MTTVYSYKHVPTILRFSKSDAFLRAIVGPFGSGKTSGCVIEIAKRAQAQAPDKDGIRRTRCAVVRNSYPQLMDTTIPTFMHWLGDFGTYKSSEFNFYMDKLPMEDGTSVEAIIHFRPLDRLKDVRNLLSLDLTFAYVNEAKEIPKSILDALTGRVGRYPPRNSDGSGGPTWFGIWMDTNPPDTDHWFYKLFEEQKPVMCKACLDKNTVSLIDRTSKMCPKCRGLEGVPYAEVFKQPSGLSPDAENLPYLPPNYYEMLAIGKSKEYIDVFIHGKYGYLGDGKPIYSSYDDDKHYNKEPLSGDKRYPLILSLDNTGLNQAAVICQFMPNGQLRVLHEFLVRDMGTRRFVRNILKPFILSRYFGYEVMVTADPAGVKRSDTDERSSYDELKDAGFDAIPARTNSWQARFNAVDSLLNKYLGNNQYGLLLSSECTMLRRGFLSDYRFKRVAVVGEERFTTKPDKNEIANLHDALQYAALLVEDTVPVRSLDYYVHNLVQDPTSIDWRAWV